MNPPFSKPAWPADTLVALLATFCPAPAAARALAQCPGLRRLYVAHADEPLAALAGDPRVRTFDLENSAWPAALQKSLDADTPLFAGAKVWIDIDAGIAAGRPAAVRLLKNMFVEHTSRVLTQVAYRLTRGWQVTANLLVNLPRVAGAPDLAVLQGTARNRPLIVVGAGPSLDRSLAELAACQADFGIIACDGAYPSLVKAGVRPDWVVSTDGSEKTWRYFAAARAQGWTTPVVCLPHSNPAVFRHHPGPKIVALAAAGEAGAFVAARTRRPWPSLDVGLCVGHAALELARWMGADPIIMVGFDLGYLGARFHPQDMPAPYFHEQPPDASNRTLVMGNDGQPMATEQSMLLYLREFERRLAVAGAPRTWNATAGGARITGAEWMPLATALERAARSKPAWPDLGTGPAAKRPLAWPAPDRIAQFIRALMTLANGPTPATAGDELGPLPQLRPLADLVTLLEPMLNPVAGWDLDWSWQQTLDNPGPAARDALCAAAQQYARALLDAWPLVPPLLGPARKPHKVRHSLLFPSPDSPPYPWPGLAGWLRKNHVEEHQFDGDPADLPLVWSTIRQADIGLIVHVDNALMPAAWSLPGIACLALQSQPPAPDLLKENWLPGYAVAVPPDLAAAWRQAVPADVPVLEWDGNDLLLDGRPVGPADWLS